jgi:hypothetical protein
MTEAFTVNVYRIIIIILFRCILYDNNRILRDQQDFCIAKYLNVMQMVQVVTIHHTQDSTYGQEFKWGEFPLLRIQLRCVSIFTYNAQIRRILRIYIINYKHK